MKVRNILVSLSLIVLFANTSFASTFPNPEAKSSTVAEIYKSIKKLELNVDQIADESVMLKFMVNDNNEIIILSTKESSLDGTLKANLNYKHVKNNDLTPFKIYLLPIRFES